MSKAKPEKELGYSQITNDIALYKSGLHKEHITNNAIRLRLHHFNVNMFDTQGKRLIVFHLMKRLEQPTWFFPLHTQNPHEKFTLYSLMYKIDINKYIYGNKGFTYPLLLDYEINYVKRTSKQSTVRLKQADQSSCLATATTVEVNIDPVSKQPKPYPDWWKKKLNIPENGPQLVIQPVPKPMSEIVLSEKRKIYFTDTDGNNHTNYATYIPMCLDSFYNNVLHDKYPRAQKVFLNGWVKTLTVVYKGDSVLDDILTIDSWEDSNRQNTYHFEISNNNKTVVNVSLEFYTTVAEISRL